MIYVYAVILTSTTGIVWQALHELPTWD